MARIKELTAAWVELEILNWDKYNPRKDLKTTSWLRLSNTTLEDPDFYDFAHAELLTWIYILSLASKKQSGLVRVHLGHLERIRGIKESEAKGAIEKLQQLQCVRVTGASVYADDAPTLRAQHTTNERTNVTNERNETNAATSDEPMIAPSPLVEEFTQAFLSRINPEVQQAWVKTYEGNTAWIKQEIRKAVTWTKANPKKAPKSDFARFMTDWLARGFNDYRKGIPSRRLTASENNMQAIGDLYRKINEGEAS